MKIKDWEGSKADNMMDKMMASKMKKSKKKKAAFSVPSMPSGKKINKMSNDNMPNGKASGKMLKKGKKKKVAKLGSGKRFAALTKKLSAKGASNPKALAAYIGRKKYGNKKMASMAAKGKKMKRANDSDSDVDNQKSVGGRGKVYKKMMMKKRGMVC